MKISIEGFDQSRAVELGLCVADMVLLRWFVDFSNTGAMEKRIIDGKEYFWISYEYVLQELPILKISKKTLYRCFKDLVDKGILTHAFVKDGGSYSFYGFGKGFFSLVSSSSFSGAVLHTSQKPPAEKKPVKNSLTKKEVESRIAESFTGESLRSSFNDFLAMRVNIKKPISTSGALTRMINRVKKLSDGDESLADKILDQSIRNNWQDIYPLKERYVGTSKDSKITSKQYNPAELARDDKGNLRVF